ncbi:MAG: lysophospholipid acyltransferase family protein [Bacteroidota bacterium]
MDFLKRIYAIYAFAVFAVSFLCLFPFFCIPIAFPKRFKLVGVFSRWCARLAFYGWFIPVRIQFRSTLDPTARYIFCANHFSYIDIPAMALNPHNTIFVGKHSMESIPLFGYMYRKLHITVDRSRLASKYSTYDRSTEALQAGKSLIIFPEGGIVSKNFPEMARFKSGPFRLAVEQQVPIVPVTLPSNWIALQENPLRLSWKPVELIFHEPVMPDGTGAESISRLQEQVYNIIQQELNHAHRTFNAGKAGAPLAS